jgi:hypothetical protein
MKNIPCIKIPCGLAGVSLKLLFPGWQKKYYFKINTDKNILSAY